MEIFTFFSAVFKKSCGKVINHIIHYTRNKWICHFCTEAEVDSENTLIKINEIIMII